MDAILLPTFVIYSLSSKVLISIKVGLKFVVKGPLDNKQALVHIMVWRRKNGKPLFKPMIALFTDEYMHHVASIS